MRPPRVTLPHPGLMPEGLRLALASAPAHAGGGPSAVPAGISPWVVIGGVGGLCWLVITGTAILWMWPYSGTIMDGSYVMTATARAVQHLMVFLLAVPAYRVVLALGWPQTLVAALRVAAINVTLAAVVIASAPMAAALATGLVDRRAAEMNDVLSSAPQFFDFVDVNFWMGPLRFFLPPYVLGLCAAALVLVARRRHSESLRAAELERACSAARLATLSAQLQPHFLFNSLHAISALIAARPRQAETMLARLGDFLRYALENTHWPWVELATELTGLEAYLEVQRTRFSDRLNITIEASEAALQVYIPSLLLQPLAENAIEHGRSEGTSILYVRVTAAVIDERLHITVSNSNSRLRGALSPSDYGRGLSNVALRLQAAYAGAAYMTVTPDPGAGTTATLDLPLRSSEQLGLRD